MKKTLLYTTALITLISTARAFAADIDVTDSYTIIDNKIENNDGNINFESGTHNFSNNGKILTSGDITVDGGSVDMPSSTNIEASDNPNENTISRVTATGDLNMNGGTFTTTDTLMTIDDLNVDGGTLNININSIDDFRAIDQHNLDRTTQKKIMFLDVKNDMNMTGGEVNIDSQGKYFESHLYEISKNVALSGGKLQIDETQQFHIGYNWWDESTQLTSGGTFTISDDAEFVVNLSNVPVWLQTMTINGGEVTLNGSDLELGYGDLLSISGGVVNLQSATKIVTDDVTGEDNEVVMSSHLKNASGDIELSGGTVNLKGGATFNVIDDILRPDPTNPDEYLDPYINDMTITGGTINVTGESNSIGAAGTIGMSGGQMNIAEDAQLNVTEDLSGTQGTLTLSGTGDINVAGEMNSDLAMSGGTVDISSTGTWNGDMNTSGDYSLEIDNDGNINFANSNNVISNEGSIVGDITMGGGAVVNKGTITGDVGMTGGAIDLAGELTGDVSMTNNATAIATINLSEAAEIDGNVTGTNRNSIVNFDSDEANITGNATGAHLVYNTDNSLSNSVGGTISNLSALTVGNGKTLTYDKPVSGKISSVFIDNGAGLDLGTNTMTAGDVHFAANSNLALRIASTDVWGRIKADSIDISRDNTTLRITIANGLVNPGEYRDFKILDSESGVTGGFLNKIPDNSVYNITYLNEDTVRISLDREEDPWGDDPWDTVREDDTESETTKSIVRQLEDFWQHDREAHNDMIRILRPDTAPAMQQVLNETTGEVFNAVGTRLSGSNVNIGRRTIMEDPCYEEDNGVWVHGIYNKATLDENKKTHGFDSETKGVAMGIETRPTRGSKIGIGYAYTQTDIEGYYREDNVEAHSALLYGEIKPNNWFLNAIGTYTWADFEESKNAYGIPVKGKSDMEMFGLQIMTGYDIHTPVVTITPEAGIRYMHLSLDDYTDTAEQQMDADDLDIITGVLGAKFSQIWIMYNGVVLRPELRAALTYDLTDDGFVTDVTLVNGAKYKTTAETLDRLAIEVGAGLTAEFNQNVEMSIGYDGRFREDYENHTGMIAAKYKF